MRPSADSTQSSRVFFEGTKQLIDVFLRICKKRLLNCIPELICCYRMLVPDGAAPHPAPSILNRTEVRLRMFGAVVGSKTNGGSKTIWSIVWGIVLLSMSAAYVVSGSDEALLRFFLCNFLRRFRRYSTFGEDTSGLSAPETADGHGSRGHQALMMLRCPEGSSPPRRA